MEQKIIPFEERYDDIKNNPNLVWQEFEPQFVSKMKSLAYKKNFEPLELINECYIYFVRYCNEYDPYYNNGFIPFDKYIWTKCHTRMLAYCQHQRFAMKREPATDFSITTNNSINYTGRDNMCELETFESNVDIYKGCKMLSIEDLDFKMAKKELYSYLTPRDIEIIEMTMQGMKQKEIEKKLNISQSAVSNILNKRVRTLVKQIWGNDLNKKEIEKLNNYKKMRIKNQRK